MVDIQHSKSEALLEVTVGSSAFQPNFSDAVFYMNDPTGRSEVVQKGNYNNTYTYNIYGNDNIGQILRNSSSVSRYYYLKDHLGSIKMVVSSSGAVDSYNDYYPFGMPMEERNQLQINFLKCA